MHKSILSIRGDQSPKCLKIRGFRQDCVKVLYNLPLHCEGRVAERLNAPVLKTGEDESPP